MPSDPVTEPSVPIPGRLTLEEVRKVARLARLVPGDAQAEDYRTRLSAVLGYVERLRALDLSGVEPMAHPMETTNRLAGDDPGPTLASAALMAMAPQTHPPFVKVPKVIGEDGA
jgi:aspartyl-tRNA(Asn)/glutamyl-tRNA(Gln) amidotransferase subunit C